MLFPRPVHIGIWILTGVVPTLIYCGLLILSSSIFLPATVVICAITPLATAAIDEVSTLPAIAEMEIAFHAAFKMVGILCAFGIRTVERSEQNNSIENLYRIASGLDLYSWVLLKD